jgi:polysaccharide biosynthesis protein PslA
VNSVGEIRADQKVREIVVSRKEMTRVFCCVLLMLSDVLALAVSFLCANAIYWRDLYSPHGVTMLATLGPIYVCVAIFNGSYDGRSLVGRRHGIARAFQALVVAAALILLVAYFLQAGDRFSRAVFAIGMTASFITIIANRVILRQPILKLLRGTPYATVIVRDGIEYTGGPFEEVVTPEEIGFDPTTRDPMQFHAFAKAVSNVDRLIIACPETRYQLWSSVLKSMAVNGQILTGDHDHLGIIGVGHHAGRRTLVITSGYLGLPDRILKRILDILMAGAGILLLSPILVVTALAVRFESKGPALFRQDRIGRDNRIFRLYKFRSMYIDQCDDTASKLTARNDSRVTKVGAFIRRSSIDELPQLLNVLKGDMSIVGPRPHPLAAKAADLLYWDADPRYRHRHAIKPGLTGLAQVRGFRGNTERVEDLTNRLNADLEYAANWSIWKDFQIILQTFPVFWHPNAF